MNIGLAEPPPFDPAVANAWATILNTNFTMIDAAVAGLLPLDVSGSSNIVLTFTNGSPSQSTNQIFACTGALTGNVIVLFPNGKKKAFIAQNFSSGPFSLSFGVNNGSGLPVGDIVTVPTGQTMALFADGTDVHAVGPAPGTGYPSISGGFSLSFTVSANTTVALPPSGNIPNIQVGAGPPGANPGIVGGLYVVV